MNSHRRGGQHSGSKPPAGGWFGVLLFLVVAGIVLWIVLSGLGFIK